MVDTRLPRTVCLLLFVIVVCPVLTGCNQSSAFMMNESGKSLYAQGQFTGARREFERALIDNPDNPDYAFNVASAMRKQGDLIGAERMFRHALTLDPRHQPAHHGLAGMLVDQGRVPEADSHLREWAETQPYLPEAHIENAWLRRDLGDLAAAEQAVRQALQADPNHPVALAQLGELYDVNGRPGEAQAMYQRSLSRNPFQSEIKARMSQSAYGGPMSSGIAMAAYPQQGPWGAAPPMPQGASPSSVIQAGASPRSVPFQGFASTPGPNPTTVFYGQQVIGAGNPQPVTSPAWPTAAAATYANPVAPGPFSHPQPIGNADPAHVPMSVSSGPVVTPF